MIKLDSLQRTACALTVSWLDGSQSTLPYIWLRDNDPDELHPQTHERVFDLTSVALDIQPTKVILDKHGISIDWPDKAQTSHYSNHWLHEHRPGIPRPDAARIEKQSWAQASLSQLSCFDAQRCYDDTNYFQQSLETLKRYGIMLIQNLEHDPKAGERFGDLIGFKRETNFGVMFDVKSKPEPNNLAYTSLALPLHTDLANQEFVPGNQFLHCYLNQAEGGQSRFVDAMSIVDQFKQDHPDYYQLLCDLPVPFRFVDDDNDIRYHRPIINLSSQGKFKGLTFNAHIADVADFAAEMLYDFYAAFRQLMIAIKQSQWQIEYQLQSGEMVIFDNQRILHGRASFNPNSGARHLRGYYIEHNEIDNKLRMLDKNNN